MDDIHAVHHIIVLSLGSTAGHASVVCARHYIPLLDIGRMVWWSACIGLCPVLQQEHVARSSKQSVCVCSCLPDCPECYTVGGALMGYCNDDGLKSACTAEDAAMMGETEGEGMAEGSGGYGLYGRRR